MSEQVRHYFPSRWLLLLLVIGFVDLVTTAVLHRMGLIVELNPLMKPIIEESEWLFAFVKGATLALGWYVMWKRRDTHREFIRKACAVGCIAYVVVWTTWFVGATFMG